MLPVSEEPVVGIEIGVLGFNTLTAVRPRRNKAGNTGNLPAKLENIHSRTNLLGQKNAEHCAPHSASTLLFLLEAALFRLSPS